MSYSELFFKHNLKIKNPHTPLHAIPGVLLDLRVHRYSILPLESPRSSQSSRSPYTLSRQSINQTQALYLDNQLIKHFYFI